jgi:hypothetical protein
VSACGRSRALGDACSSERAAREGERRGNGENRPGLRILLPKTCKSDVVASYTCASSHTVAGT